MAQSDSLGNYLVAAPSVNLAHDKESNLRVFSCSRSAAAIHLLVGKCDDQTWTKDRHHSYLSCTIIYWYHNILHHNILYSNILQSIKCPLWSPLALLYTLFYHKTFMLSQDRGTYSSIAICSRYIHVVVLLLLLVTTRCTATMMHKGMCVQTQCGNQTQTTLLVGE